MRLLLALLLTAGPAFAQQAPEVSERPESRPAQPEEPASDTTPAVEPDTPDPDPATPETPEDVTAILVPTEGQRDLLLLAPEDHDACLARLDDLGVSYQQVDPIVPDDDRDCGILQPIEVTELAPGVAITPPATLRCLAAEAAAIWTRDFVLPAAARLDDRGPLVGIDNGSGYICRRRNNAATGKLSEHAFGNALDVMGFRFAEGPAIPIEPREAEGSMSEAFQDAVRATACLEFTTVLGPGSNAAHADHLHLDIVARSSGYRLCEQGGIRPD